MSINLSCKVVFSLTTGVQAAMVGWLVDIDTAEVDAPLEE